jgi:uncharacterized protein
VLDTGEQLKRLKQQIAAIELRFAQRRFAAAASVGPQFPAEHEDGFQVAEPEHIRSRIEEWADGEVAENEAGQHFQTERLYPAHRQHGVADIGALCELPAGLMDALGFGKIPPAPCGRWAFLDTETTGLAGGSGTYAFLIGVGRITKEGFRVRQFFMRECAEEASVLRALHEHLTSFDTLITYNGKTYDQPLLETRYRMCGQKSPFGGLAHLDLLHGARRLWKLRLDSCRLMELERQILGFHREGDLPGEMIPYVYFECLRSREAQTLMPIFHHNAMDILTLACLTAIVPAAFRDTNSCALARLGVRRGEDLAGIGRWLLAARQPERALELMKRALEAGLPDRLLPRTLSDIGVLEKKLARRMLRRKSAGS